MPYKTIRYQKQGHRLTITLARPEHKNAINRQMVSELSEAWERAKADDAIRVVVLTGDGDAFTIGIDHEDVPDSGVRKQGSVTGSPMGGYTPRRARMWKPVIAAVNGDCCSHGGWVLTMDCDLAIASENATFYETQLPYGRVLATEAVGLARRIPFGEVVRLMVANKERPVTARRAYDIGLVAEVVPQRDLLKTAYAFADHICTLSPLALQGALQNLWRSLEIGSRQIALDQSILFIQQNRMTEDFHEGLAAIKEHRKPKWA